MRTYVEVELFGLPGDPKRRYRTKLSPTANSINPVWKEEPFIFEKVLGMGPPLVSVPSSWPVPTCLSEVPNSSSQGLLWAGRGRLHTLGLGIETLTLAQKLGDDGVLCLLGHWLAKLPRAVCMGSVSRAVHLVNFPMRS